MTFSVLGRSTNGTIGASGIWNPSLGGYNYTGSYDALRTIGPGYAWYATGAPAASHRNGRTVHAMVFVPYVSKLGIFDVSKVKLTFQYAILK